MARITTVANVPDELLQAWLQHLRDFDTAHPGCRFKVTTATDMTTAEIGKMLDRIDPPFPYRAESDA